MNKKTKDWLIVITIALLVGFIILIGSCSNTKNLYKNYPLTLHFLITYKSITYEKIHNRGD